MKNTRKARDLARKKISRRMRRVLDVPRYNEHGSKLGLRARLFLEENLVIS